MQYLFRNWFVWSVALLVLIALPGFAIAQEQGEAEVEEAAEPVYMEVQWQDQIPSVPSDVCAPCMLENVNRMLPKPEQEMASDLQAPGLDETVPQPSGDQLPGDFRILRRHMLNNTEAPSTSNVTEPTAACNVTKAMYTGNWFAARSTNAGNTWTYVNPYTVFTPPSGMSFCCDQEVIYERSRGIFIWSLLYINAAQTGGVNRIAISKNTTGWWYYDFHYSTTILPDYPHLRLSDNYLYLTCNLYGSTGFTATRLLRLPLTDMAQGKSFSYNFIARSDVFNFVVAKNRFVQSTAFFASNYIIAGPYDRVRIFHWDENSTSYSWNDVTVSAWSWSGFTCTAPDGTNPCGRMDDRLLAAIVTNWGAPGVSNKVLWLGWNAGPITGRPKVYSYVVKINLNDFSVIGYADVWNSDVTWGYPAMGVNDRGHLALSIDFMGSPVYVDHYLSLYDDYTASPPPGWEVYRGARGYAGPSDDKWGDYNWADQYFPKSHLWLGTGHVKPNSANVDPYFYIFGRDRDYP